MIERRPTRARCFPFGDQRSVEHTLETLQRYRDPNVPTRRVRRLQLLGDALSVLATIEGVRDIERAREGAFSFTLETAQALPGEAQSLSELSGVEQRRWDPAPGDVALIVGADQLTRDHAEAIAAASSAAALPARLLVRSLSLEPALTSLLALPDVEATFSPEQNPLLNPSVEAFLAGHAPQRVWIMGAGPQLLGAALGCVDYLIEYEGGPATQLDAQRMRALGRRVLITESLARDADLLDALTRPIEPLLSSRLNAAGVERAHQLAGPIPAEGIVVYPITR